MTFHSTFIKQDQVHKELSLGIDEIDTIYSKIKFILHEDLYPLEKDSYHFIGQLLKKLAPTNRSARAFASTLFKTCYQSEILSAGGANIAYLFGVTLAKELIRSSLSDENTQEVLAKFDSYIEKTKANIEKHAIVSNSKDLKRIVDKSCGTDKILSEAIWEALQLAGLEGRIFVENGKQDNYFVELKEGYSFYLKPFKFMLEKGTWERRSCKVLVVDGLVEKVSELDHVLTKSLETKVPMVIIAHGFSEEVVATLRANQERGLLDVQPVRVPTDIDALNIVNDIAVVCGGTPVSSMKGDLLVFTKYEDIPIVDRLKLGEAECSIENPKTRAAVSAQAKTILEKRQSHFLHEEVQELFDKRLRSLISSTVLLHLPNMTATKIDECRVKIDISLRQVKTILNYGTVNLSEEMSAIKDQWLFEGNTSPTDQFLMRLTTNFQERLKQENITKVPTISAVSGMMLAGKAILLLMTSSGFVELVD